MGGYLRLTDKASGRDTILYADTVHWFQNGARGFGGTTKIDYVPAGAVNGTLETISVIQTPREVAQLLGGVCEPTIEVQDVHFTNRGARRKLAANGSSGLALSLEPNGRETLIDFATRGSVSPLEIKAG